MMAKWLILATLCLLVEKTFGVGKVSSYRPQFHFSVPKGWMNDPNGLSYYKGEYHIYYQYYPDGITAFKKNNEFGPMSWGHATSTDLVHWKEQPIAIGPDVHGQIFSGGIVIDPGNTAGFKKGGEDTFVALFTQHLWPMNFQQQQSLAYSNDKGKTWTMYPGNPVIPNVPEKVKYFMDPKPMRYGNKWVLAVSGNEAIQFYSSTNLKQWTYMSTFEGKGQGSHAGYWECPDLIQMHLGGATHWVLLVSIDAKGIEGGPNGGSATQYFVGHFDGTRFTTNQKEALWVDWGPDFYAAVTFTGAPKVMSVAWMNNWLYAEVTPTGAEGWRGGNSLPREHKLVNVDGKIRMTTLPASEIKKFVKAPMAPLKGKSVTSGVNVNVPGPGGPLMHITATIHTAPSTMLSDTYICFLNLKKQEVCAGVWKRNDGIKIAVNRIKTNLKSRSRNDLFAYQAVARADRQITDPHVKLEIYLDVSSIEIFADGGLTAMTATFFVDQPLTKIELRHSVLSSAVKKGQKLPPSSATVDLQVSKIQPGSVTPSPNGGKVPGRSYSIPTPNARTPGKHGGKAGNTPNPSKPAAAGKKKGGCFGMFCKKKRGV